MSKETKPYWFYSLIDNFGMWLTGLGEGLQGWALRKMGHESLASAYSPSVPEETAHKIFKVLEAEECLGYDNHPKAIVLLQEAIELMDPYMIQKRDNGELFLDDEIENELGIEYEEVVSLLYDRLLSEKKYKEAIELCNKMLKIDLGFLESAEYWGENLYNARRQSDPKVGRNDPCPCGSGKKYKKCCGR